MITENQPGIYCLENKETSEKFINSTKNIYTYEGYLINKLNKNKHSNKRLQEAWNKVDPSQREDIFELYILENIDDATYLSDRKKYWITRYNSNVIGYGYNLELLKRPWEQSKEKNLKEKSWGVDGSVQSLLLSIVGKLDYSIEFSDDRKEHLINVMTDKEIDWLVKYISSPLFCKKQIKTKRDYLAENDLSLIGMSYIVDYLVFPKYKNKKEKQLNIENQKLIRKKKSEVKMDYRRGNEKLFGSATSIENEIGNNIFNPNVKDSKKQKLYKVKEKHEITKKDLEKYPEIAGIFNTIMYLSEKLGYGKGEEAKNLLQKKFEKEYGSRQLGIAKGMHRDLSAEVLIMKEILTGTIRFKKIDQGTTIFNYDMDTGYFKDSGEYVSISENKIDLSKEKHVLELLNFYSQLKQKFYDKPDHDMSLILHVLDELIEQTKFEDYIKNILIMKIDGYEAAEIIEEIESKYGVILTDDRLSRTYNETIPKMIVETYLQSREDWIYTYKIKGTYKICAKCKATKLATTKYFSPNKQNKDGFHSYCRLCR